MPNLTEIAKMLIETFPDSFFPVSSGFDDVLAEYNRRYAGSGGAVGIQIGKESYIVINEDYSASESQDIPDSVSPLFYGSINDEFSIIDARTSATLIDEVYSRITYMQRLCENNTLPDSATVIENLSPIVAPDLEISRVETDIAQNGSIGTKANIFQCYLLKDTGVSASPDTYSFMMKNGIIKEIPPAVMNEIRHVGTVQLLKDSSELEANTDIIRKSIFDKFSSGDIDIRSVNVKSIFEVRLDVANIHLMLKDNRGRVGRYDSSYIAGERDEFKALNASIHKCNCCDHDIIDVKDDTDISYLHINIDVMDPDPNNNEKYEVGCENCLEQCPVCGSWHFKYSDPSLKEHYKGKTFAHGRGFVKSLRDFDTNYCECREGIEWVYDDDVVDEDGQNGVMRIEKMAFVNFANEVIATYNDDYKPYYAKARKGKRFADAAAERDFACKTLVAFKKALANQFDMDDDDVKVVNADKCGECNVCGGKYYGVKKDDFSYRCDVCKELISEKRRMVTRTDGVIFMRSSGKGSENVISKYLVTKHGNLKKMSSMRVNMKALGGPAEQAANTKE